MQQLQASGELSVCAGVFLFGQSFRVVGAGRPVVERRVADVTEMRNWTGNGGAWRRGLPLRTVWANYTS